MPLGESQVDNIPKDTESPGKKVVKEEVKEVVEAESDHYKVGDGVDCKDTDTGAWFEAVIEKITANDDVKGLDNLAYHIKFVGYEETKKVIMQQLRPLAKKVVDFMGLNPKQEIMVNYNRAELGERRSGDADALHLQDQGPHLHHQARHQGGQDGPRLQHQVPQ